MNTQNRPRLELVGGASENPALEESSRGAVDSLRNRVPGVPLPELIQWRSTWADEVDTEVTMSDSQNEGGARASRRFYTRWLADPLHRDISHLQVLSDLLAKRTESNSHRVDRLVRELTAKANEEAHAAQPN